MSGKQNFPKKEEKKPKLLSLLLIVGQLKVLYSGLLCCRQYWHLKATLNLSRDGKFSRFKDKNISSKRIHYLRREWHMRVVSPTFMDRLSRKKKRVGRSIQAQPSGQIKLVCWTNFSVDNIARHDVLWYYRNYNLIRTSR